jgi:hypothetical protein
MENEIPQEALDLLNEYKPIWHDYKTIKYRMGTNGERGLYPKYKSLSAKLNKISKKLKPLGYKIIEGSFDIKLKKIQS